MRLHLSFSVVTVAGAFAPTPAKHRPRHAWMDAPIAPRASSSLAMARTPFISGNWKLNPSTKEEAVQLATDIAGHIVPGKSPDAEVALFVPFVFIPTVLSNLPKNQQALMIGAEVRSNHQPTNQRMIPRLLANVVFSFLVGVFVRGQGCVHWSRFNVSTTIHWCAMVLGWPFGTEDHLW